MKPKRTAKQIVLELLTAAESHRGSAAHLIAAAGVVGIDENNVRVALTRLVAAGTLELAGRGEYRLGEATRALTAQVTGWRDLEKQVRRWDGAWACVQLGDLARTDRAALRRRERALRLTGFRELGRGFAIRPDNLAGGVAALREQLVGLGVEDRALVFRATDFDDATERRARGLWDAEHLDRTYRATTARVEREIERLSNVAELAEGRLRAAARDAFAIGSDVLRTIMFDPRLPEPLVDVGARRALVDAMRRLDAVGRGLWARLFGMPYRLVVPVTEREESHVQP